MIRSTQCLVTFTIFASTTISIVAQIPTTMGAEVLVRLGDTDLFAVDALLMAAGLEAALADGTLEFVGILARCGLDVVDDTVAIVVLAVAFFRYRKDLLHAGQRPRVLAVVFPFRALTFGAGYRTKQVLLRRAARNALPTGALVRAAVPVSHAALADADARAALARAREASLLIVTAAAIVLARAGLT